MRISANRHRFRWADQPQTFQRRKSPKWSSFVALSVLCASVNWLWWLAAIRWTPKPPANVKWKQWIVVRDLVEWKISPKKCSSILAAVKAKKQKQKIDEQQYKRRFISGNYKSFMQSSHNTIFRALSFIPIWFYRFLMLSRSTQRPTTNSTSIAWQWSCIQRIPKNATSELQNDESLLPLLFPINLVFQTRSKGQTACANVRVLDGISKDSRAPCLRWVMFLSLAMHHSVTCTGHMVGDCRLRLTHTVHSHQPRKHLPRARMV